MTRKDYELIAKTFLAETSVAKAYASSTVEAFWTFQGFQVIANRLADALAKDNPAFDRERFLTDCGVTK